MLWPRSYALACSRYILINYSTLPHSTSYDLGSLYIDGLTHKTANFSSETLFKHDIGSIGSPIRGVSAHVDLCKENQ